MIQYGKPIAAARPPIWPRGELISPVSSVFFLVSLRPAIQMEHTSRLPARMHYAGLM